MILLTTQTGFLKPIAWLLGQIFNGLFNLIYNIAEWFTDKPYHVPIIGISVILFTIIVRLILLPMTIKQQKFSKLSGLMNPELQEIQAKYKDKRDQVSMMNMQAETKAVYEKYGVSPTGSCLQMFIQMPIFFALYQVIINIPGYISGIREIFEHAVVKITSVNGYAEILSNFISEEGIRTYTWKADSVTDNQIIDVLYNLSPSQWTKLGEISDFSGFSDVLAKTAETLQPMQNFLGLNIADTPLSLIKMGWSSHTYVLILAAILIPVLSWLTQMLNIKLMPVASTDDSNSQMNATMKSMNTFMPLFSAFICFSFPVGIGIYWIIGSLVRCIQQLVINRHLDNMDMDDFIKKNQEKMAKKRAKAGLPPQKITQQAKINVRNIEEPKRKTAEDRQQDTKNTSGYYTNIPETKPGSLASKANMVAEFDKKNKTKKK